MVGAGQSVVPDAVLDALVYEPGELREIASTIRATQRHIITRPAHEVLVVQGGPGTGRTLVGLQRVSWLLQTLPDRLAARDVLIVGPSPTFIRYLSTVLPQVGDPPVVQLPISGLGPRVRVGRLDPRELRRLKGDRRMLRLIVCALRNRQRVEAEPIELRVGGRVVYVDGKRVAARARDLGSRPHNEAHRELALYLTDEVRAHLSTRTSRRERAALRLPTHRDMTQAVDSYLEQAWPALTPQAFLVDLLSSRRELTAAAAGLLTDDEVRLLASPRDVRVGAWQWSVDDVPLLDTADTLLNGLPTSFGHIVVDEAQDLSPMQLESIRRRSRDGALTLLGDLAQATSPWARGSWDEVVLHLRRDRVPVEMVELEHGYRLPAEVLEVAKRVLPITAPHVRGPQTVRSVDHPVLDVPVGDPTAVTDVAEEVVGVVRDLLGSGVVGVVVPGRQRARVAAALERAGVAWSPELRDASAPVVLLSATAAKGLELDSIVVVEPAQIVEEAEHGLRALYVVMTRCTTRLALVHAQPLPTELGSLQSGGAGAKEGDARGMDTGPQDRQWAADRDRSSIDPVTVADDWAHVSEGPKAEDAWEGPTDEIDRAEVTGEHPATVTGEHLATQEPPNGGDWRLSIPREFVARTSPVRDLAASGEGREPGLPGTAPAHMQSPLDAPAAEPTEVDAGFGPGEPTAPVTGPDNGLSTAARASDAGLSAASGPGEGLPGPPVTGPDNDLSVARGRDEGLPAASMPEVGSSAPETSRDRRRNGANGVSPTDQDLGDGPWSELDRDIARAVAITLAAKLTRYVNPSILPLVADELGQLVDDVAAGGPGPGPADEAAADAALTTPRHLR